jgi:glycosyl-4,4'-diaponeurosporenoate acyltransferase
MAAVYTTPHNLEGTPALNAAILTADILGWPILQLSIARASLYFPERRLTLHRFPFRFETWEIDLYRRMLRIKRWKHLFPDGAAWIGGQFPKRRLALQDPAYLQRFALEARRGELAHWCMLFCFPIFYPWNPPWACAVMTIYALMANLPCIVVQRYNRITIQGRLASRKNQALL